MDLLTRIRLASVDHARDDVDEQRTLIFADMLRKQLGSHYHIYQARHNLKGYDDAFHFVGVVQEAGDKLKDDGYKMLFEVRQRSFKLCFGVCRRQQFPRNMEFLTKRLPSGRSHTD